MTINTPVLFESLGFGSAYSHGYQDAIGHWWCCTKMFPQNIWECIPKQFSLSISTRPDSTAVRVELKRTPNGCLMLGRFEGRIRAINLGNKFSNIAEDFFVGGHAIVYVTLWDHTEAED